MAASTNKPQLQELDLTVNVEITAACTQMCCDGGLCQHVRPHRTLWAAAGVEQALVAALLHPRPQLLVKHG